MLYSIDLKPNASMGQGYWTSNDQSGGTIIRMYSKHQSMVWDFAVGYSERTDDMYLVAQPSVIAAKTIDREEIVIQPTDSDRIEIRGKHYVLRDDKPFHDPRLQEVEVAGVYQ